MFDVGITEIIVIIVVSALVFEVKDLSSIIKAFRKTIRYFNDFIEEIKQIFLDIEKETNKIIDLEGKEQITYDLNDIMPDIKKERQKKTSKSQNQE